MQENGWHQAGTLNRLPPLTYFAQAFSPLKVFFCSNQTVVCTYGRVFVAECADKYTYFDHGLDITKVALRPPEEPLYILY